MSNLVSVEWLKANLQDENVVVLDASMSAPLPGQTNQPSQFIAGARKFDFEKVFCDTSSGLSCTMPTANQFQRQAQELGISKHHTLVVYDNIGIYSAPRAWWMFKAMGHDNVKVLNGGLPQWLKQRGPVSNELVSDFPVGNFVAVAMQQAFVAKEKVLDVVEGRSDALLIDARSPARYSGAEADPRPGIRAGHIPNSHNLHYKKLVPDILMLDSVALEAQFRDFDTENWREAIFTCGSGITACILCLAATEIGLKSLHIYDGSWSEWGKLTELPIA